MESNDAIRLVEAVQRGDLTAEEFATLVNKENKGSVPPRNSGPGADQIVTIVPIIGALLMAAGTVLPWVTVLGLSINGFNGHLPIVTVLIVLSGSGSLVFLINASWSRLLALILSSVGLSIGGYFFIRLLIGEKGEVFGEQFRVGVSPGVGLWAIVIGGLACVGVHTWVLLKRPKAPQFRISGSSNGHGAKPDANRNAEDLTTLRNGDVTTARPDGAHSVVGPSPAERLVEEVESGEVWEEEIWQRIELPSGKVLFIFNDGTTNVEFPDGREAWIYEDATVVVEFPDGSAIEIGADCTTKRRENAEASFNILK